MNSGIMQDRGTGRVGNKNLMKFSKGKCKVLPMGKYNPGMQCGQRSIWCLERDLGLNMSGHCAVQTLKASGMLGCIGKNVTSRDALYPLVKTHILFDFCSDNTKRMQTGWRGSEKSHKDDQRTEKRTGKVQEKIIGFIQP